MRKKYKNIEIDNPLDELALIQETSERVESNKIKWQYTFFYLLIIIIFCILFGKIFFLQIIKGDRYTKLADNNRIRKVVIRAPRGIIKDINGKILARNIPSFELNFIPAYLTKNPLALETVAKKISSLSGVDSKELLDKLKSHPITDKKEYHLIEHLETSTALRLAERSEEFIGINVSKVAKREYPYGEIAAHIIGYDGKINREEMEKYPQYLLIDYIGKSGVEEIYEKYLHGKNGEHRYEVDARGKMIRDLGTIIPEPGYTLTLNIDIDLQKKIFTEAKQLMEKNKEATGVIAVAIDPRNGAVRALVNYPSFDNNLFSNGIKAEQYQNLITSPSKPLINKAISGLYPPGSTFKPLVAVAGLEEKVITAQKTITCPGVISVGKWKFPDWKTHGTTNLKKAIAESCDVYFYAVGGGWHTVKGLGIKQLQRYSKFFGLGDFLGIDLPGEKQGSVPATTWKFKTFGEKWYIGDTYHSAIGQGYVTATPLQVANIAATIANGGKVFRPRVAKDLINQEKKEHVKIEKNILSKNFATSYNINLVKEAMKETVVSSSGSGRLLNSLKITSGGKTGTAQFGNEDKTHSWYISFAPYNNTKLAMAVLVEGGGEGHSWSVPLTKEVYKWYFDEKRGEATPEKKDNNIKKINDTVDINNN